MLKRRCLLLLAALATITAGTQVVPVSASPAGDTALQGKPAAVGPATSESVAAMMSRQARTTPNLTSATTTRRRQPGRENLPQDPASNGLRATPEPQTSASTGPKIPAQTPSTQILGATLADSGFLPPDSMGAVGPTQFLVIVNGRIRTFNKGTGLADGVLDMTTDTFFALVRAGSSTSDPRVRYDRLSGRWFFTMVNTATPSNRVLVAFSSGSVIGNGTLFTETSLDMSTLHPGCLWDYDTLGIDASALYIGGNLFCGPNQDFTQTEGLVMSKANLLGGSASAFDFHLANNGLLCPPDEGPYTPQGVDNYDPLSTVGYFVGVSVCTFGRLDIVRVTNPTGSPTATKLPPMTVPLTQFPIRVPALGTTTRGGLDALDDRLFAAHLRNGHLWTASNIGVDHNGNSPASFSSVDRDATRWYDVTNLDTTPGLSQAGTLFDPTPTNPASYWMPSIMVSGQGHAAIGNNVAGPVERPDAMTTGRFSGDPAGSLRDKVVYQATPGTATYNPSESSVSTDPHRWGDYSYTSLDPNDDMTMWTIQEFVNSTDSWGVKAVKLVAPPPATPTATDGTTFNTNQCSQEVAVTGTSNNGSGFYDPGPGLPNRLQATISGGVTVNRVLYADPTHITLDVSTQGATAGPKNLTVTNPDGQTVTVNNFLTVGGASTQPDSQTAVSVNQYTLSNSNGSTWQEIDPSLRVNCTPIANQSILLSGNADLFTGSVGYNQDIGIFVSDNAGADSLLAWKESGGFAGTFSPNAAFVQTLFSMAAGHSYVFKLKWKTNKPAGGATIFAGAAAMSPFSPTSLIGESFPSGVTPNFVSSTKQYTLPNNDGSSWVDMDTTILKTTLSPSAGSTAVLGANVDLFTGNSGYNQDVGIFVSDNGQPDVLVAWKESGGFAGVFSPNAAFVKAMYAMTGGHTYVFKMKWKTNKNAPGVTIFAGAGSGLPFSPTSLVAETLPTITPFTQKSTAQYTLPNSDGSTWLEPDAGLRVSVSPGSNTNSQLGANIDLFTGNAGFNQDVAIFVSDSGGADTLVAWKESGGFAGIFSPNAAFVQAGYRMLGGHTYVFKLKWKTNKFAGGATIFAGAGPPGGPFSPTRLTVELAN